MSKPSLPRWIIPVAGIIISAAAIYYLTTKIDLKQAWQLLLESNPLIVTGMVVVYLSGFILRGFRWKLMLKDISSINFKLSLKSIILGYAGNNVLPARGGEFVRMEYFSRFSHVSRVTSLSSIFTERMFDGMSIVFILLCSILLENDPRLHTPQIMRVTVLGSVFFIGAVVTLIVIGMNSQALLGYFGRIAEGKSFLLFGQKIIARLGDALLFVKRFQTLLRVTLLSLAIWAVEGLVFGLAIINFGLDISPPAAFVTLAVVNLGLLIPSSPAFIGVFHGLVVLALGMYGVVSETALSLAILVHATMVIPITTLGGLILIRDSLAANSLSQN